MFKKFILFIAVLFIFTGCANQEKEVKQTMDRTAEDGNYYYQSDLGFSLVLPKEFEYYQVQRKGKEKYTDVEFFVPTSDTAYEQEVQSYAKAIVIRIYKDGKELENNPDEPFEQVKTDQSKVYLIKFWDSVPSDWQEKWSNDIRKEIFNSFK